MPENATGFGEALRRHRERAGLTQLELAVRARCSVIGVARLEQGSREPTWRMVLALADALGVTPNDFVVAEPAEPRLRFRGKPRKAQGGSDQAIT